MTEATATVKQGRKIPAIWVVPIVAAVLGIYLVVYTFLTEGPTITITFETASGIEAGKTKIKSLNVELGEVESVELTEDMEGVRITARLDKSATPMLREDTQFWVERPRIGPGGISGLGTILSGGYIQLSPGKGAEGRREFTGLENPPVTPAGTPGLKLSLISEKAGAVSAGDPILYRDYQVGQVETARFEPDTQHIVYEIFIEEEYEQLITDNTRFWNASGIALSASAQGVDVEIGSLQSLLVGGVAFDLPDGTGPGEPATDGDTFTLLRNRAAINDIEYENYVEYVVAFEQSVSGLSPGAPVEYRGIQVGTVQRLLIPELMMADVKTFEERTGAEYGEPIPVLIRLEPARLGIPDSAEITAAFAEDLRETVAKGLRASLKTGNLLTGQLLITFDYYPDAEPAGFTEFAGYTQLPTLSGGVARIQQQISALLAKLNDLEVEPVVEGLDLTLISLRNTLDSLQGLPVEGQEAALPGSLGATLRELNSTLDSYSPDSQSGAQLNRSLSELNQTLRSLEELARQLSDKPNSIIFSPPIVEDPVPQKGAEQ